MANRQKIIAMTKMAVYDKNDGSADRHTNEFFRHDYIYRKNMWTRLCAGIGGAILLALYWLRLVFIDKVDLLETNLQQQINDSVLFMLALLAVYSLIGTIQGTRQYYLMQKRLERYNALIAYLEHINERAAKRQREAAERSE
jgi:hypothetical protein